MCTSRGMGTIHKNFIAPAKEDIEVNTLSPTSTNQVKQYIQEVEKSKFHLICCIFSNLLYLEVFLMKFYNTFSWV